MSFGFPNSSKDGRDGRFRGVLAKHRIFLHGISPQSCVSCTVATQITYRQIQGAEKLKPNEKMGKTARVVMCGLRKVGKTAILEQLIYGNISKSTELHSTIEDIYVANIETDRGTREKVRFYDICGLDQPLPNSPASRDQPQLPRQYFGLADGYVLVYDTDRPESLDALVALKKDIDRNREKKELVLVVIGNRIKQSEVGNLENTASKAAHWAAREKIKHFEVNAMDRNTLFEPFVYLTSRLNPPPNKSTFPQLSMVRKSIGRPDTN